MTSPRSATERYLIRPASMADVPAIHAIERQAFTDPWSRESFTEAVGRAAVVFLVAVDVAPEGERVVGYAMAYHAAGESELANVAVEPGSRGAGVGAMLVNAILDGVHRAGAMDCWLEVRASNAGARRLYRHLGFEDVGVRKRYYAHPVEDAIVMRRVLGGV